MRCTDWGSQGSMHVQSATCCTADLWSPPYAAQRADHKVPDFLETTLQGKAARLVESSYSKSAAVADKCRLAAAVRAARMASSRLQGAPATRSMFVQLSRNIL